MNVNLFAISISDMGSLVTLLWTCVLANPGLIAAPVDFIPIELAFLTGGKIVMVVVVVMMKMIQNYANKNVNDNDDVEDDIENGVDDDDGGGGSGNDDHFQPECKSARSCLAHLESNSLVVMKSSNSAFL